MTLRLAWLLLAARVLAGAILTWYLVGALTAPDLPWPAAVAALVVLAVSFWHAGSGLVTLVAVAPAGLLLAPPPVRAAELVAWSFLAAWLLAAWRPLSPRPWPRTVTVPAVLYAAVAAASWLGQTIRGAAGVEPAYLPAHVLRSIPADHLVFSSPRTETWTLLIVLTGIVVYLASVALAVPGSPVRRWMAIALAGSAAVLAAATLAEVWRQWSAQEYGGWYLLRYLRGERFSLHLADLNAAGSHYVLGALAGVALALASRTVRWVWAAPIALILAALWLTGSRAAGLGALLVGTALVSWAAGGARRVTRAQWSAAAGVVLVAGLAAGVVASRQDAAEGSAGMSMRLRGLFLVTSSRMFASAPMQGVGIGRYHERSAEFMPDSLRAVYPHENAHNYFAQQFAELGVAGGVTFAWLIAAALLGGWRGLRDARAPEAAAVGLFAGTFAYALTCVTGHPLLVVEAALPFWAALGATAAAIPTREPERRPNGIATIAAVALVSAMAGSVVARAGLDYRRPAQMPDAQGLYPAEAAGDGAAFNWMTRHAVMYIGPQPGFLTLQLRAPASVERARPFVAEIAVGGRVMERLEVPRDRWASLEIPLRRRASTPFRRVDIRANQSWTPKEAGMSDDVGPRSLMVRDVR